MNVNTQRTLTTSMILGFLIGASATAGTIPYPNAGTQNATTYAFTASSTGDIVAYFYGTGALYTETLGLYVNGVSTGITGLNNHSTAVGTSLDLGHANAGDTLTFFVDVLTTGDIWYSSKSLNSDTANHVYSTAFGGGGTIPAGTYVGFEDEPAPVSDFNYADEQFVFSNTSTLTSGTSPEPANMGLAGLALAGIAAFLGRRKLRRG